MKDEFINAFNEVFVNTTEEKKCFVYFNSYSEIVCVSAVIDPLFIDYKYITVPLKEVEGFLLGTVSPTDYIVDFENEKIEKKKKERIILFKESRFLSEIKEENEHTLFIINNIKKKTIKLGFNSNLNISNIIDNHSIHKINIYFTIKHEPWHLIKHVEVMTSDLITPIKIQYTENLQNTSVYVKQYFDGYSYKELQ